MSNKEYNKFYYIKNKDRLKESFRVYGRNNHSVKIRKAKYYQDNKEKMIKDSFANRNKLKSRLYTVERRAKRKGIVFELDLEWAQQQELKCFYTGRELTLSPKKFNTVSFDKVNPQLGYTKDNTVLCCFGVNVMKGALNIHDFYTNVEAVLSERDTVLQKLNMAERPN